MRRFLGFALLALALLQFGYRGAQRLRSEIPLWDFASPYAATLTWLHGGDPYDTAAVIQTWHNAHLFPGRDANYFATVYPPSSLLLLTPLAAFPPAIAMVIWLLITLALLALQFIALVQLARWHWRDSKTILLLGAALAAAPLQFGVLSGQLSLPAISMCIIAFWCVSRDRAMLAGALLGIATALKPQVAAPFVAYFLFTRRWKTSGVAITLAAAIALTSVLAMRVTHIDWLEGWTHSIALTAQSGGVNDYGFAGTFRDEIMDLKMLVISLPLDGLAMRIAIECVAIAMLAWYVRVSARRQPPVQPSSDPQERIAANDRLDRSELLALATLGAIALLPVYHRVYDAAILTTALAWALAELDGGRRSQAIALLIAMSVFLIPFDLTGTLGRHSDRIAQLSQTRWWQALVAPHYAWGVLALCFTLLAIMSRHPLGQASSDVSPTSPERAAGVFADDEDDEPAMLAR